MQGLAVLRQHLLVGLDTVGWEWGELQNGRQILSSSVSLPNTGFCFLNIILGLATTKMLIVCNAQAVVK